MLRQTLHIEIVKCFRPAQIISDCWSLVFNDLSYQAIKTRNIIMKSNGKQMRNFITMTDFCRSINHIIKFLDNKNEYNVFNIGGEKYTDIRCTKFN